MNRCFSRARAATFTRCRAGHDGGAADMIMIDGDAGAGESAIHRSMTAELMAR
jgi:hypothetical protein